MDTGFLNNTANVLIICGTIVTVILLVIWVSNKKNLTITKEGIKIIDTYPYDILQSEIPGIDEWLKNKLRASILDNVDTLFGLMEGLEPLVRQLLLLGVLDEMSQRISLNGFAKILSSNTSKEQWVADRKRAIISKVRAHESELSLTSINAAADDVLAFIVHEFALRTRMACEKKILVYEKQVKKAPNRLKPLIKRNQQYIEVLKTL